MRGVQRHNNRFVFFASDGGDGFFALDSSGKLKRGRAPSSGRTAEVTCSRGGSLSRRVSRHFLRHSAVGKHPGARPSLEDTDLDAMVKALRTHRDRYLRGYPTRAGSDD